MKKKLLVMILLTLALSILFTGCSLGEKEIARIDVGDTLPRQFEYGSTPDFSGVNATIVYNDESTKTVSASELEFGAVDTTKPGKQTLTVTYGGFTQNFEVEVLKKPTDTTPTRELTSIEYVSGIPSAVYAGDTIVYGNLVIKAKFNNDTEELISLGINTNVKYNTIDTSVAEKQTITFTYMNKTCSVDVDVQAIKVVKIEVDYGSIGDGINADTIKVSKIFNNGSYNLINGEDLVITQNGDIYTVTYVDAKDGTFTATIDSSSTPILESIEILATGYENFTFLVGDSFSSSGILCKAHYSNGTSANLAHSDFTVSFSTSTAGDNNLTVTYNENESITATMPIKVREIQTVRIDTSSVKTKITAGSTIDASAIKLSITCTDGTTVSRTPESVDLENLDLTTPNDSSYITATYNEIESEKLYIYVIDPVTELFIFGAELPESLTSIESKKELFKNKTYGYYVGDDNPFILKLIVSALDENDEEVPAENIVFKSYYELYLDGVQLTDNLATYVTIDAANHTLDFTDEAIGKTFKIVVCPEGRESLSSNVTVTVVNGLNIYEAWELNYLTNMNDFATSTIYGAAVNQLVFVDEFLNGKGATSDKRPTALAGVVLHSDLTVKPEDLPRQYFLGEDYTQEFWDRITIFPHANDSADKNFTFYGNYFTIHTHLLPNVCKLGTGNQDGVETATGEAVSNAQLFRFTSMAGYLEEVGLANNSASDIEFDSRDYNTTIKDLYLRDDNPSSNNEWKGERALRGLIAMKLGYQIVDLDNVRLEAFYIGVFLDYDGVAVNINDSIFYNAYQNHVYIWCENALLDNDDALPADNHLGSIVNVTSSSLTKCGGPVFLAQTSHSSYAKNSKSAPVVNVNADTEIWSFVTGDEVWFDIIGQTAAVKNIISLGEYYGSPYVTNGTSFITQVGEVENLQGKFINLVMISLDADFGGSDVDGTFTIVDGENTTTYLDMSDTNGNYGNADVSNYIAMSKGAAPVIETATGGVLMYTDEGNPPHVATNADKLTDGDYISFFNMGMGIVLGFNVNDTIERLPATE